MRTEKAIFSEVKGPGDRLSDKQTIWMDLLNSCGAHVELCHVVEMEEKAGKKNKKTSQFDDDELRMLIQDGVITFPKEEEILEIPKKNALQRLLEVSRVEIPQIEVESKKKKNASTEHKSALLKEKENNDPINAR